MFPTTGNDVPVLSADSGIPIGLPIRRGRVTAAAFLPIYML